MTKVKKLFIVTDLGPGDGGKGGVVHKLATSQKAHTVVKVGGAQGSHGVRTSSGQSFNFSHFGCGTLDGIRTHISENMIIEPYRLMNEAERLENEWRIHDVYDLLTVDENALCVTPFHTFTSRLRELLRKDNPKGTVGVGVGEALRDFENHPKDAIFVKDLKSPNLQAKLESIRRRKLTEFEDELDEKNYDKYFKKEDRDNVNEVFEFLKDEEFVSRIVGMFGLLHSKVKITDSKYFQQKILGKDGVIVVEASHGVLNDRLYGFQPHTTALRILPSFTIKMLEKYDYDGKIIKLGITRAYQIRHGAGPMVTRDDSMLSKLLPGSTKDDNRWQGAPMVGPLDFVALQYAINICGGPKFFDGLAITWADQVEEMGEWNICIKYKYPQNIFFTRKEGMMRFFPEGTKVDDNYQKALAEFLKTSCRPVVINYLWAHEDRADFQKLLKSVFEEKLKVPVRMISYGPTEKDKVLI